MYSVQSFLVRFHTYDSIATRTTDHPVSSPSSYLSPTTYMLFYPLITFPFDLVQELLTSLTFTFHRPLDSTPHLCFPPCNLLVSLQPSCLQRNYCSSCTLLSHQDLFVITGEIFTFSLYIGGLNHLLTLLLHVKPNCLDE